MRFYCFCHWYHHLSYTLIPRIIKGIRQTRENMKKWQRNQVVEKPNNKGWLSPEYTEAIKKLRARRKKCRFTWPTIRNINFKAFLLLGLKKFLSLIKVLMICHCNRYVISIQLCTSTIYSGNQWQWYFPVFILTSIHNWKAQCHASYSCYRDWVFWEHRYKGEGRNKFNTFQNGWLNPHQ